ncbi:MAG: hypothetical protein ACQESG_01425 [Nanobdellota archaeon]
MALPLQEVTISIIIGVLAAIVYSLRILVLMERRISRIEIHIENLASRILSEELKIEKEERSIEDRFADSPKKASTKKSAKKSTKKSSTKKSTKKSKSK